MLKYNNRALTYNSRWLNEDEIPINLPANTVRLRYADGIIPTAYHEFPGTTLTQISSIPNIWDITHWDPQYPGEWHYLFDQSYGYGWGLVEVMAANVSNITNMTGLFGGCSRLYKVCDLNTPKCTDFTSMFNGCDKLISVGSIDMSKVIYMSNMFAGCSKLSAIPNITLPAYTYPNAGRIIEGYYAFSGCRSVTSGSLDLYNRLTHKFSNNYMIIYNGNWTECFKNCGIDTETGAAELAQIPAEAYRIRWK